jgi:hypothetical protein
MFPSTDDLDARLMAGLGEEARRRTTQVAGLLQQVERFGEWQATEVPVELRSHLLEQQKDRALELALLLLGWKRLGGTVALLPEPPQLAQGEPSLRAPALGGMSEAPRIVELPPRDDLGEEDEPTDRVVEGRRPANIVPSPTGPPPNPASAQALAGLKAHVEGGGAFRVQAPAPDWPVRLREQLQELLPARDPDADLAAVLRVVDAQERWKGLPFEAQAPLIGLLAARLRALQEQPGFLGDRRVDFAFGTLSAYVKRTRPGYVYGLARWHQPNRDSWEADAEAMFERMAAMLPSAPEVEPNHQRQLEAIEGLVREIGIAPAEARSAVAAQIRREVLAAFAMGIQARNPRLVRAVASVAEIFDAPEFRALRRALRDEADASREEADSDGGAEEPPLPADWPWWGFTRGRRALIVGGDPREPSRVRLERAFGFTELEWVGAEFKRNNLLGVRDRVRAGRTDLVILLTRFTGHDADQIVIPACREMGVGFVCVPHGYGVVRVRQAIERFLDPEEARRR